MLAELKEFNRFPAKATSRLVALESIREAVHFVEIEQARRFTNRALPMAEMTVQREKERELKRALWEIRDALDAYRAAREAGAVLGPGDRPPYPATLQDLTQEVVDARADRQGQTMRFLRRVPRDPFAEPGLPAEQTWGLRGYQSDADTPQPGPEVYDVYSKSTAVGLNGVPLKQW